MTFLESYALGAPLITLIMGFGLGWYVKGRGLTGVTIDAGNAIKTVEADATAVKAAV